MYMMLFFFSTRNDFFFRNDPVMESTALENYGSVIRILLWPIVYRSMMKCVSTRSYTLVYSYLDVRVSS